MNSFSRRGRNAMLGLAIGDALGWPSMFHRSQLLPSWTRRIRREMDATSEGTNVLPPAMPFSLNQSAAAFEICPTDDTEWAAFTSGILLESGRFEEVLVEKWIGLARSGQVVKGGVSTQAALTNLRKGLKPPQTGRENPHYFDDGAIARAVPVGVFYSSNPEEAAEKAGLDASVTNAEDGVWASQAMAAAINLACSGKSIDEVLEKATGVLPPDSLIRRKVDSALGLVQKDTSVFSVIPELSNIIINREYSYGNAAPETLALTFAIMKTAGNNFEHAVTAATSFAKTADALPSAVGALAGAMTSSEIAGEAWLASMKSLKGICIPSLRGTKYLELTDRLVAASMKHHNMKT